MAGIRRITLNGNGLIGDEGVRILAETLKVSRQVTEERFSTIRPQHSKIAIPSILARRIMFWFGKKDEREYVQAEVGGERFESC